MTAPAALPAFKTVMHLKTLFLTLAFAGSALAAGDPDRGANLVILNEAAVKSLSLTTAEAEEGDFEETLFALGRIRVAPGHRAVVSSRVPGRALSVPVKIDTFVEKGAEAVVLESRQPGDPPPSVRLLAPISGQVSAVNVAPGQPVGVEDSLVEILDLGEVHAVAAVPEHLAGRVRPGQKGRIRVAGYPDREFEAHVEHLGAEADEAAGTIEVAFHVENPEGILRPGMRAEFSIVTGSRQGVLGIPAEAVQGDGVQRFVYVADYELKNAYLKTPVVTGARNDRLVEVTAGVLPGDQVVARGAYALVFAGKGNASLKEALDAAHGHPHADDGSELGADEAKAAAGRGAPGAEPLRAGGPGALVIFFAATTGLLLLLLLVQGARLRRGTAA